MLDAVVAATEHLVVTYTGANETTGQPRPPAVPLGELLDTLDATAAGRQAHVLRRHPLQPFDRRNLDAVRPVLLRHRRARRAPGPPRPRPRRRRPFLADVELPPRADDVELATWSPSSSTRSRSSCAAGSTSCWPTRARRSPTRCRSRSTALAQWQVGDRMLRDLLGRPHPAADARQGVAPRRAASRPARLAARPEDRSTTPRPVAEVAESVTQGAPRSRRVDVDVDLGDGRRLRGTVTRPLRRPGGQGELLPARSQAPARGVGAAARAVRRAARAGRGPRARSAAATRRRASRPHRVRAPSTRRAPTCCATWSPSTTPGCASRCRCR